MRGRPRRARLRLHQLPHVHAVFVSGGSDRRSPPTPPNGIACAVDDALLPARHKLTSIAVLFVSGGSDRRSPPTPPTGIACAVDDALLPPRHNLTATAAL